LIEFFGGVVKRYLHENCDYTYDTLKENHDMPKAMESVKLEVILGTPHVLPVDACIQIGAWHNLKLV
jgi:hypothetical protein